MPPRTEFQSEPAQACAERASTFEIQMHLPNKLDVASEWYQMLFFGQQSFSKWQMLPFIYLYLSSANARNEQDAWVSNGKGSRQS